MNFLIENWIMIAAILVGGVAIIIVLKWPIRSGENKKKKKE